MKKIKTTQSRKSSSSKRWLQAHQKDPYVQQAQKEGYRSRAVYKLLEINKKDQLIQPGMTIVDLGAAPGGWSEIAQEHLKGHGKIIAIDILPMKPLPGVACIQGDFTEETTQKTLIDAVGSPGIDLILSDMAPNMSGIRQVDQLRSMVLAEAVLDFAERHLNPGADLLIKVFQGSEFDTFLRTLRSCFRTVHVRKPTASRPQSREVYLLAKAFIKKNATLIHEDENQPC